MKKIMLLIAMLVVAVSVKAQGHFIVPEVGLNGSGASFYGIHLIRDDAKYDMSEYKKMKLGLSAGVRYRYESNKRFVIETGILYNQYGYSFKDVYHNNTKTVWNYSVRYHHLSVPVMFGYKFIADGRKIFTITPKLGLQFGYYVQMEQKYNYLNLNNQEVVFHEKKAPDMPVLRVDIAEIFEVEFGWHLTKILDIFASVSERYSLSNMFSVKDYYNSPFKVEQDIYELRGDCFIFALTANVGLRIKVGQ